MPTPPNKIEGRELRDVLVGDAVEGARASGQEVNVPAVQDFIVDVLKGMDLKKSEAQAKPTRGHTSPSDKKEMYEEEFEKRTGRKLEGMRMERDVLKQGKILSSQEINEGPLSSIIERIRIVNSKNPDGTDKYPAKRAILKNLTVCMNSPKKQVREQAADALEQLFAWTDKIVGYSWQQPKPTIITVS